MNSKLRPLIIGILFVFIYVTIASVKPVIVQEFKINLFLKLFVSFLPAWVFFAIIQLRKYPTIKKQIAENWRLILVVNIFTCFAWIGMYYSLEHISPAEETFLALGLAPLLTVLWDRIYRPKAHKSFLLMITAGLLSSVIFVVAFNTIAGGWGNKISELTPTNAALGVASAVLSAIGVGGYVTSTKRMKELNWAADSIMAVRYPLLLVVSLIGMLFTSADLDMGAWSLSYWEMAGFLIFSAIFQLYVLQLCIERLEPLTVTIIASFVPLLTTVIEFGVEGTVSILLLLLVSVGCLLIVSMNILSQNSKGK